MLERITLTSNDLYITQVQLELGSVATDFEHRSYGEELALCQRYYEEGYAFHNADGAYMREHVPFMVTKRISPTIVLSAKRPDGAGGGTVGSFFQANTDKAGITASSTYISIYSYRAGLGSAQFTANQDISWKYTADAEL